MPRRKSAPAKPLTQSTARKRQLASTSTPLQDLSGSRQSKRLKASTNDTPTQNSNVTPKKSKYFEQSGSEEGDEDDESSHGTDGKASSYDDDDISVAEPSSATSDDEGRDDDDDSDTDAAPRKRGKKPGSRTSANTPKSTQPTTIEMRVAGGKRKEIWRPGVKAGLGPGNEVFIEKPKPRGDGGVKYLPGQIHPNTMAFLADLKKNNDREWMKMNDPDYRTSWRDWQSFVESLTEKIIEKDDTIPELPPKDLVFRVYRDIRFSPDPTPYKPYFSAAWSRTGRKGPYAGYYVQIAPGKKTFVGCGLWMPEAAPLALLRADIDRKSHKIKRVLMDAKIRKVLFNRIANDEKAAVKAFIAQNGENALKTKPKGYEADNPNIGLLRLKNFTIGTKLDDKDVTARGFGDAVAELVEVMAPFVQYLNSVIMPDDDDDDEDENEDDEEEDPVQDAAEDDDEGSATESEDL